MAHAQGQGGVFAQVGFRDAVEQRRGFLQTIGEIAAVFIGRYKTPADAAGIVEFAAAIRVDPVVVPTACAGGNRQLRQGGRALSDQIDRTTGVACADQQAGCAAQHLDAVVDFHVRGHPAGHAVTLTGHAIDDVALVLQREAPRTEDMRAKVTLGKGDAGRLGHHFIKAGEVLSSITWRVMTVIDCGVSRSD